MNMAGLDNDLFGPPIEKIGFPEKNKMSICLVSSKVLWEHLEMKDSETNPLMRSLPQVVFTAAFLKTSPALVCLRCCCL
jgi:hypothetical protein